MQNYYYYNPYTGYGYSFSEHAKLRIWERFRTLDIAREFKLFHRLLTQPEIDDVIANMHIHETLVLKNCWNNKVYVVMLTEDLNVQCQTVYRDNKYRQFMPEYGQTLYRLYKDGSIHKWVHR